LDCVLVEYTEDEVVRFLRNAGYSFQDRTFVVTSRYSDWLRTGRTGDRIPVGARFSVLVQNGPGAHPASYTMGIGSFPGVKQPGSDADPSPPSTAEVKERFELYFYSPFGVSWPVLG
jgi:hypothetical protein